MSSKIVFNLKFIHALEPSAGLPSAPGLHLRILLRSSSSGRCLPLPFALFLPIINICRKVITIAYCALEVAPVLAFYCAKLHLVANTIDHEIPTKGINLASVIKVCCTKRICFFGSCGIIDREIPTKGIDLAAVTKARCAECTPRESRVGKGFKAQIR
ncbi:hypothetical protein LZL87_009479 [Fusarium oxysporum]|nr:hypothetical protein LZL87_009479 [Fusarium oxysporum]